MSQSFADIISTTMPLDDDDVELTPSQAQLLTKSRRLLQHFKVLVIKGDSHTGKHTVAMELFKQLSAMVIPFDLCGLATSLDVNLSSQHVIAYLNDLANQAQKYLITPSKPASPLTSASKSKAAVVKRQRRGLEDDLAELSIQATMVGMSVIYIRNYNRISDVLSDYTSKLRHLLPLIIKTFVEKLPPNIKVVITAHTNMFTDTNHWCVELSTTREDMVQIVANLHPMHRAAILTISKLIPIGQLLYCLKYALAMDDSGMMLGGTQMDDSGMMLGGTQMDDSGMMLGGTQMDDSGTVVGGVSFLDHYRVALAKFSGSSVDIDKDVPNPVLENDLVGMETIIDEIETSVIKPMQMSIPGIPIKKGLLLCGSPGTGKTSIGRWLAHQIKGKFYLIGGEAGINGSHFIECLESNVRRARANAPAVVFIDDCDVLFEQADTYRAFLTVLDGIETNKRNDICVIVTCMNLRNVPASLLRGGRLEMVLITKLPTTQTIQIILEHALLKLIDTLKSSQPPSRQKFLDHPRSSLSLLDDPRLSRFPVDDSKLGLVRILTRAMETDLIRQLSVKMSGWNCADIHRCVNDVSRLLVAGKGTHLPELFEKCIKQIRDQYTLCGKTESTNSEQSHDPYIT